MDGTTTEEGNAPTVSRRKSDKGIFRFKKFECRHCGSSIKIGVDAVLIGAWAGIENRERILDVGTGCGVIALMCCQRNSEADVTAIDIDDASLEEAQDNFKKSLWSNRVRAIKANYLSLDNQTFDYIISNPPFYSAGVLELIDSRMLARHQGELSPGSLLQKAPSLLQENGGLGMIIPVSELKEVLIAASKSGLKLSRYLYVKGNKSAPLKRILLEFTKTTDELCPELPLSDENVLVLESSPGKHTMEYREMCKDFYLKF